LPVAPLVNTVTSWRLAAVPFWRVMVTGDPLPPFHSILTATPACTVVGTVEKAMRSEACATAATTNDAQARTVWSCILRGVCYFVWCKRGWVIER